MIAPRPTFSLPLPGRQSLALGERTLVMGVLNVTPDSFSDGGTAFDAAAAIERALALEGEGADLIDVGAESTRPGASPVDADEEWRRLAPVLRGLAPRLRVPLSIDTYRAATAARALAAGAVIVNDVSGLLYEPALGEVVAKAGAALVLMHSRGRSQHMYREAQYGDVVGEVTSELRQAMARARDAGVPPDALILDPGFGFAKQAMHSLTLLARLPDLSVLERPLLSGPSRKSFLTAAIGQTAPAERDWATAAAVTYSVLAGAHIVRVHRVAEMVQVVRVADSLRAAAHSTEPIR